MSLNRLQYHLNRLLSRRCLVGAGSLISEKRRENYPKRNGRTREVNFTLSGKAANFLNSGSQVSLPEALQQIQLDLVGRSNLLNTLLNARYGIRIIFGFITNPSQINKELERAVTLGT